MVLVLFLAFGQTAFARAKLHIIRPARGTLYTAPSDISGSGQVIATISERTNFLAQGGRQVRGSRNRFISLHPSFESQATSVSADGSVVVGWSYNAAGQARTFRWTKQTGAVDISSDPDVYCIPIGVSGDGQTIVGTYWPAPNRYQPFVWSPGYHFQALPLGGYDEGYANGTSYDGNVIVGFVGMTNGHTMDYACRWINKHEPELLDPAAGGTSASAITPDGSLIVGGGLKPDGSTRAFYWTRWGGMQWVEAPADQHYFGFADVSADGGRMIGDAQDLDGVSSAVLSTGEEGARDLNDLYSSLLPRGWRFDSAVAISSDGRWIVGTLGDGNFSYRGYILDTGR